MSLPAREDAAAALDQQRGDFGVVARLGEGGDQRLVHRAGQRVLLFRPRQGDDEDGAVAADLDEFAHALSARIASQPSSGAAPD